MSGDEPVRVAARAAIAWYLQMLQREASAARAGRVEGIHRLRVAARRLRATLALFESVLPRRAARHVGDELRWLGRTVGPVRDLDVLGVAVAKRARKLGPPIAPLPTVLTRHLRDRRAAAHAILVDALGSPRVRQLLARLTALAASEPGTGGPSCRTVATDLLRPLVRSVRRAGRDVDAQAPAEVLHALRVRVKRLRYALESLEGLGGEAARDFTQRLAMLQELLGEQHDAVSQEAWLRAEAPAFAGESETLLTVGALCEALRRRATRRARRVPASWKRASRRKLVVAALLELGPPDAVRGAA